MHEGKDDRDDGGDDVSRLGDFDLQWFVVVALVVVLIIGALWAGRADGAEPPAQAPPVQAPPVVRVQAVRSDTPPTPAAGRGVAARAVGAVTPPVMINVARLRLTGYGAKDMLEVNWPTDGSAGGILVTPPITLNGKPATVDEVYAHWKGMAYPWLSLRYRELAWPERVFEFRDAQASRAPPVQPPVLLGWNVTGPDGSVRFVPATSAVVPAPGVPVPYPFRRGPAFDPDHTCNVCGASQYVVSGAGPRPGTHSHRCNRCGNSWFH